MASPNPIQQPQRRQAQQNNGLTLKSIVAFSVTKWYWFVISLAVTLSVAALYLMKTTPEYTRTASLLIKNEDKNGTSGTSIDMSEIGLVQKNSNLENEIRIVKSPALMREVVKRLNLNDHYTVKDGLRNDVLYRQTPVLFAPVDSTDNSVVSFNFTLGNDGKITVGNVNVNDREVNDTFTASFGDSIQIGGIVFEAIKPEWNQSGLLGKEIRYTHVPVKSAATSLAGRVTALLGNDKSSIIDISITCPSIDEADDILETLIQVYNERWIEDKNQIAVSTSRFIDERLGVIEKELGNVDSDISSYKSEHLLPDVGAATAMYMAQSSDAQAAVVDLSNQISVAEMVRSQLSGDNFDQPLPTNTGIVNADIENAIVQYNNIVIERNRLLESTSEINPIVKDRTQALRTLKGNIMASINAYIATLRTQMSNARRQASATSSRIAANPSQAKYLLSVERQQKVKESLYLFLLQKREENELTQAFTAYNTSMVEEPHGSNAPTFPKKRNILMISFLLGIAIPLGIFVLRESLDTKIRGKKDLAPLKIPYLGEIPSANRKPHGMARLKKHNKEERRIVVATKSRDAINEAFRVLRTNLEYMGVDEGSGTKCKVIAVTSANPGSGKAFISINLAKVLAIKGKRVLLLDLDIRKGSLSKIIGRPDNGIVDFLVGKAHEDQLFIKGIDETPTLDAIGVGIVPPNPAELLSSEKLDRFIAGLRERYDFIILDCPPVEIVTDAKVINRLADMTLFVVRAGLLEKDELPTIQEYYDENRYRNMAILLNATDIHSGYGYHRYGYHYGYGKGYGSGYSSDKD
ncbi:MAG: polysaccharide biosynthesis tyrosine autokinase [Muribaculaceae bacterium]|nr:polysaccharide biosynthesis tyrosine autokinase [Muribaculaceae bacterium]